MSKFTVIDVPQRSPEWFAARCGRLTASCAGEMLASIKSGEAAARRDLRARLVCERLTNMPQDDGYTNAAMEWGIEHEADARAAYEAVSGQFVQEVGFISHTELLAGGSPDGVLGNMEGLVEFKAPKSATHLEYLRLPIDVIPSRHIPQLTHLLWLTDVPFIDFVSYDPRFPEPLRLFCRRLYRDEAQIASYALAVSLFLSEVQRDCDEMTKKMEAVRG